MTAAHTHRMTRICERQGVPILADLAYQGGGPWVSTGSKRRPLQELTLTEKTVNQALAAARAPVERGVARLRSWQIFRRSRCSPNRMTSVAKAVLTRERQGLKKLSESLRPGASPADAHLFVGAFRKNGAWLRIEQLRATF